MADYGGYGQGGGGGGSQGGGGGGGAFGGGGFVAQGCGARRHSGRFDCLRCLLRAPADPRRNAPRRLRSTPEGGAGGRGGVRARSRGRRLPRCRRTPSCLAAEGSPPRRLLTRAGVLRVAPRRRPPALRRSSPSPSRRCTRHAVAVSRCAAQPALLHLLSLCACVVAYACSPHLSRAQQAVQATALDDQVTMWGAELGNVRAL
jgi:hypothetical protein